MELKLNKTGKRRVNSISYKTKKTQSIVKFMFIWTFNSDMDLKPHS
jgi:hypothetical protein